MFAYALACILIFGQCPFIFNNFPFFPPAYRFFLKFPFIFLLPLALFIHFHSLGGTLLCLHVRRIILTHFGRCCAIYVDTGTFHVCTCSWLRHLLCTGLCSLMLLHVYFKFLSSSLSFISSSFSIFQLFAFFWWNSPCISTLWLRHVHQKHTPKIPEQRASPMTGSQKKNRYLVKRASNTNE